MTTGRLYLIFATVVVLFLGLIARLAYMQLVDQAFYQTKLATASQKTISSPGVRGQIYDAKGEPLVTNKAFQALFFTRPNKGSSDDMRALALDLAAVVDMSDITISDRDKRDFVLADSEVYRQVVSDLPREERLDGTGNYLPEATIYANAIANLDQDDLNFSATEEKAIALYSQMASLGYFETVQLLTDPLTEKQVAKLVENKKWKDEGLSVQTGWKREVLPTSLASIIGRVSSQKSGLPEEDAQDYLAKGYALNDRVGTSYLEKQYEPYLQGQREVKDLHLDKDGNLESVQVISESQKGQNLKLTVDLAFQNGVNDILQRYFKEELEKGTTTYSEGIYAVALDPESGAVLAMSGYNHEADSKELEENALGTVTNVFVPGSIVKGATLTAGWETGTIVGNQVLTDQPIVFAESAPIMSWFTSLGNQEVTATQALQYSSNTYMVQVALKMIGQDYQPNITVATGQLAQGMSQLRDGFAQFGLGAETGIDLPIESAGFIPQDYDLGHYLTNSFGQFDNYTPMQMAQYVATIANGGQRIAPHLVEGIYGNDSQKEIGELVQAIQPEVLNTVSISPENMALIQDGFFQVVNNPSSYSTGKSIGQGAAVAISAKTGTAETFVTDKDGKQQEAINTNVVGYAPSDKPQIAVAVVLPHVTDLNSKTSHYIMRDIINLYHQLYPMN
ncbi:penicillin-binding protein PBP2B [Streptococcus rifensis]